MSGVPINTGNLGPATPAHPSIDVFKKFVNSSATKAEAVDAFIEYVTTGIRGMPLPNIDLAKSALNSDTSHTFMGYPQLLQCMAVVLKQS